MNTSEIFASFCLLHARILVATVKKEWKNDSTMKNNVGDHTATGHIYQKKVPKNNISWNERIGEEAYWNRV
jgi:hypothetical protein